MKIKIKNKIKNNKKKIKKEKRINKSKNKINQKKINKTDIKNRKKDNKLIVKNNNNKNIKTNKSLKKKNKTQSNSLEKNINENKLNDINNDSNNNINIDNTILSKNENFYNYFENFCIANIKFIDNFELNILEKNNNLLNQSILIYFGLSPHIEFIIKNIIMKFDNKWYHSVLCSNENYLFIYELCKKINLNIEIIKIDKKENSINKIILDNNFWNLIKSKKIFIYNQYSLLSLKENEIFNYDFYIDYYIEDSNKKIFNYSYINVDLVKNILNEYEKELKAELEEDLKEELEEELYEELDEELDEEIKDINEEKEIIEEYIKKYNYVINKLKDTKKVSIYFENNRKLEFDKLKYLEDNFKICAFTTPYGLNLGGGEINLLNFAKYFIIKKHCLIHLYTKGDDNIKKNTIKLVLGNDYLNYFKFYDLNKLKFLENYNYEYHFNMENSKIPSIKGLSNKINIYHCQFPFDTNKVVKSEKINKYKHIFLNSDFTDNFYKKYTNKYLKNQLINVIYPSSIDEIKIKSKNYEKKDKSFVMIGRIFDYNKNAHNKNFDIALKYFEKLSNEKDNFEVHIIGKVYSEKMYNKLKNFKIKNLFIHRNCSNEEKNKILEKSMYILNMTGLNRHKLKECYAYEHFGISIIEGLNYCCIPISVNGGYPSYYIKNNENGYIFDDENGFNDIIKDIILNNKKIDFDKNYYEDLLSKFSEKAFFKKLDSIFY